MSGWVGAIILGRKGSTGFPGKNLHPVLGRPMAYYAIQTAADVVGQDHVFLSTDDEDLKSLARGMGVNVIHRPPGLCTKDALGEDAFVHAYDYLVGAAWKSGMEVSEAILMFCNAPTVTPRAIHAGIFALREHPEYDSAVTVSRYNMWSPARARSIGEDGMLHPFLPEALAGANCDRDSSGDVWFADMGASIVRPRCLENIAGGLPPQRWMGRKIYPIKQEGGLDVDYPWQIPMAEHWLREHGHAEA